MSFSWKRKLLLFIALCIVIYIIDYAIDNDTGYVLFVFQQYSAEMSFWVFWVALLAIVITLWLVLKISRGSVNLVKKSTNFVLFGSKSAAQKRTELGLIQYLEGDWKNARKNLEKTAHNVQAPLINYLASARCASNIGDEQEANKLLLKAEEVADGDQLAVVLTQARIQFANHKFELCVASLERARQMAPKNILVLEMLQTVYVDLEDWESLERLMPELVRNKIGTAESRMKLSNRLYLALIELAGEQAGRLQTKNAIAKLQEVWEDLPSVVKKRSPMVVAYVKQLKRFEADSIAANLLRKQLQKDWDDELVHLYGVVAGEDVDRQLVFAEDWLRQRPADANLMLAAARLSLRNQLWGKAREYLESSLRQKKSAEVCAELGRLLASLGEHERSTYFYQQGLLSATQRLPDLPMPKN